MFGTVQILFKGDRMKKVVEKILCTLCKGVGALKRWAVDSLLIMLILHYQEHDWSSTLYILAIL